MPKKLILMLVSISLFGGFLLYKQFFSTNVNLKPHQVLSEIDETGTDSRSDTANDPEPTDNSISPSGNDNSQLPEPLLNRAEFDESSGQVFIRAEINNFSVTSCSMVASLGELTKTFEGVLEEQPKFMLCRQDISYTDLGSSGTWRFSVRFDREIDSQAVTTEKNEVTIQ